MRLFKTLKLISILVFTLLATESDAQTGVSINTSGASPDPQAVLDVSSTDKGALLPRMSTAQRTGIATANSADHGMIVYDTDTKSYWYWDGAVTAAWQQVSAGSGNTLDAAYDAGGAGLGRIINADAGNVQINGAGHLTVAANIGIGTTGPGQKLHVVGTTRVSTLADGSGAVVMSNTTGDLGKTSLTGSATDVLLGTGSFGPASAFEDDDWYQTLSTNTPTAITDWIYTNGRVGIGVGAVSNPQAPLEVAASGAGNPSANSIMAYNPSNGANDAIITTRVAGASSGDPFFSMDVLGEAGWSMGLDNSHANRFKIAPSWNNLSSGTALTIKTDGNVGIGTDDPDQKFQTNGIMRSRGTYMVDIDGANGSGPRLAMGSTTDVYAYLNLGAYGGINNLETKDRDFRIGSNTAFNAIYLQNVTGNVGIGNNAPGFDLDITGNTRTTGDFYGDIHVDDTRDDNFGPSSYDNEVAFDFKNRSIVGVPGSGTYSGMMTIAPWSDNSGNNHHQINFNDGGLYWRRGVPNNATWGTWYKILTTADGLPTGSGTDNYLARWTPDGSTLGIGTTYDNGTNVGIGSTSPGQKLEVNGNISLPSNTGLKSIYTWSATDANWRIGMSNVPGFTRSMATTHVEFVTYAAGATQGFATGVNGGNSSFEIRGSDHQAFFRGDVGIGTPTPYANLNVGNPIGATVYLTREDNTTVANDVLGSLLFDSTDDTSPSTTDASAVIRGHASQTHGNSTKGGFLTFLTKNNVAYNAAATERMRIQADGNVGIGTSGPIQPLDVSGVIRSTGGHIINYNAPTVYFQDTDHETGMIHMNSNLMYFLSGSGNNTTNWTQNGSVWPLTINMTNDVSTFGGQAHFMEGNVGIGSSGPAQALHVVGTGRFTNLGGSGDRLIYANNNGDLNISSSAINANSLIDGSGAANRVAYWSDANTLTSSGSFTYGATGNLSVVNAEGSGSEVRVGAAWGREGVYSSNELQLFSDNTGIIFGDSDVETMRLTAAGNLGIGTTTPSERLEVNGNVRLGGSLALNSTGDHISYMYGVRADDTSYEWHGFYSGTTRQGIILYDGAWGGANNVTNEFSLTAENNNLLTLNTNSNHVALMPGGSANVGVGTLAPSYKLHVNGRLKTTGINETSDVRLKKNIQNLDGALEKVLQMRGVTYEWKAEEHSDMQFDAGTQYGLIAQELEKIIPELVLTEDNEDAWKSIEYSHLVPVLIEALKEQQQIINTQKIDIVELRLQAETNTEQIRSILDRLTEYSSK